MCVCFLADLRFLFWPGAWPRPNIATGPDQNQNQMACRCLLLLLQFACMYQPYACHSQKIHCPLQASCWLVAHSCRSVSAALFAPLIELFDRFSSFPESRVETVNSVRWKSLAGPTNRGAYFRLLGWATQVVNSVRVGCRSE